MDELHTRFVVTPWRNSQELLQLRQDLYGHDTSKRERAVNKILAWRSRKPDGLPLLLDSTADIVDVQLQDLRDELKHNPLRLLYATALSRFITGLADTQIELIRDKPAWFPPGKSLQLPYPLLELRHRIVHRHLPSLAELKRAAQDSLDWLWEWYWSQLDYAFGLTKPTGDGDDELEGIEATREKLQALLKTYVKERKTEIKGRKKDPQAASNALSAYNLRYSPSNTSISPNRIHTILLRLLTTDKMILPADKKLGSSMSGAFLIWDPLLLAFSDASILPIPSIIAHFTTAMNALPSSMLSTDMDPFREAMHDWIVHILRADAWSVSLIVEDVLATCFSEPTYWNLKVAETVLNDGNEVSNRKAWVKVLEAARKEDGDVDVDVEMEEVGGPVKEKIRGPTKVMGLWRGGPIGEVLEGWEYDE